MLRRVLVCSALLAVALLVSGCGAGSISEAEQQSLAAAATAPPTFQPGDKISVNVFGEEKLSGQFEVDQSGRFAASPEPLRRKASPGELEQALAKIPQRISQNPKVTVTI
jgi:polysaccharide export outer membrane protein